MVSRIATALPARTTVCRLGRGPSSLAASGSRMFTGLLGRAEEAERLFERLLGLRNDVGLLSEEYDAAGQRLVGNFPQAFSHVSLINTAHNLSHEKKPAEKRGGVQAARGE